VHQVPTLIVIYFFYGLAFFSMGLMVAIEGGRSTDSRLRMALRPLAGFGLVHAAHEWLEMFVLIAGYSFVTKPAILSALELILLAFSLLSLAAFGAYVLLGQESTWRVSLIIPLALEAVWVFGLVSFKGQYLPEEMPVIAHVWTRYSLAIPAGLLAAVGLVAQQRAFRRAGLVRFGQDSLWAAISFGWYALVGQLFTSASPLPPSNYLNENVFLEIFGFPIQALRAVTAIFAAVFVIRFLSAFQVESDRKIADLQEARLHEAQQREALRGDLFRRVVGAQEAERQRIARDLHDETGQSLTAIGLGLRGLSSSLSPRNKSALDTLRRLQTLTADSLQELQRIISDLRPSHLDDLGLAAALRWYAGRLQELTPLIIRVDITGEERSMDEAVRITIFRIIQEALNNVIKHSQASHVDLSLEFKENFARIRVRDNGCGFNLDLIRLTRMGRTSLGLAGMEERAALLGGTVSIQSRPGYGTEVEAVIPYSINAEVKNDNTPVTGG
jgi:signal transduction histidine kinase